MSPERNPTPPAPLAAAPATVPSPKRAYSPPRLVELGDVRELTRGTGFTLPGDVFNTKLKQT